MTAVTQGKIEAVLDRALDELGIGDYAKFMASMEDVVLYALCKQAGLTRVLSQMNTFEKFGESRKRIATRADLTQLLQELDEPSPEELGQLLIFLRELASTFKRGLKELDSQIKPRGGPDEKLSNPVTVSRITDEIFDRQKNGEKLSKIKTDIAKREDISLSTLDRRVSDEIKRRQQLLDSNGPNDSTMK